MKTQDCVILKNEQIAKDVFLLNLSADTSDITKSGQFVNIKIDGFYLRRPISICDYEKDNLTLIYKVFGNGTKHLSKKNINEKLDILLSLGNGYDDTKVTDKTVLVGGGVGVPPLVNLAKRIKHKNPKVILGFNTKDEVFGIDIFEKIGITTIVSTADGSFGQKGFVTDVMKEMSFDYVYTCGPMPMLKAIYEFDADGQYSFEEKMGCGFGGCMGCSCKTKYGYKRICKEGPVLCKEEILW